MKILLIIIIAIFLIVAVVVATAAIYFWRYLRINTYEDFWQWFEKESDKIYRYIWTNSHKRALNFISPALKMVNRNILMIIGAKNEDASAELIFTSDAEVKFFPDIFDLVAAAPHIKDWKFTALQPHFDNRYTLTFRNYKLSVDNLWFSAKYWDDEFMITEIVVFHNLNNNKKNKEDISNAVYLFLQKLLGEELYATSIDIIHIKHINEHEEEIEEDDEELKPISELYMFLIERKQETDRISEHIYYPPDKMNYSQKYIVKERTKRNKLIDVSYTVNQDFILSDAIIGYTWILSINIKKRKKKHTINDIEQKFIDKLQSYNCVFFMNTSYPSFSILYFACKQYEVPIRLTKKLIRNNIKFAKFYFDIVRNRALLLATRKLLTKEILN